MSTHLTRPIPRSTSLPSRPEQPQSPLKHLDTLNTDHPSNKTLYPPSPSPPVPPQKSQSPHVYRPLPAVSTDAPPLSMSAAPLPVYWNSIIDFKCSQDATITIHNNFHYHTGGAMSGLPSPNLLSSPPAAFPSASVPPAAVPNGPPYNVNQNAAYPPVSWPESAEEPAEQRQKREKHLPSNSVSSQSLSLSISQALNPARHPYDPSPLKPSKNPSPILLQRLLILSILTHLDHSHEATSAFLEDEKAYFHSTWGSVKTRVAHLVHALTRVCSRAGEARNGVERKVKVRRDEIARELRGLPHAKPEAETSAHHCEWCDASHRHGNKYYKFTFLGQGYDPDTLRPEGASNEQTWIIGKDCLDHFMGLHEAIHLLYDLFQEIHAKVTELLPRLPEWRTGKVPLQRGKEDPVEYQSGAKDVARLHPSVNIDHIERILQRLTVRCDVRGIQSNWYHATIEGFYARIHDLEDLARAQPTQKAISAPVKDEKVKKVER